MTTPERLQLRSEFLDAMSQLVASVTIVTTDGPAGTAGATVSAMTSVSADGDSPTMLVCLHHETTAAPAILANRCFCINVLSADQSDIANVFAGRVPAPNGDKFAAGPFAKMRSGAPGLETALARFDCKLLSDERIGTHHVMIGSVMQVARLGGLPLLYGNRAYQALA
ncbi:flavin reductase family protein [Litoreibacter arenae]|uniref:Putative flavin reductase n=1 Tax=Litoreibacter arenae DSM 19593 TaxID=1123360 RepID=S9RYH1_9RHOB|nr:flavin reductase family protein [Litoreibacter arenae]EPX79014.1 putative flavin reductase [Litoreibacter arenae DSM 19593]